MVYLSTRYALLIFQQPYCPNLTSASSCSASMTIVCKGFGEEVGLTRKNVAQSAPIHKIQDKMVNIVFF